MVTCARRVRCLPDEAATLHRTSVTQRLDGIGLMSRTSPVWTADDYVAAAVPVCAPPSHCGDNAPKSCVATIREGKKEGLIYFLFVQVNFA